MLLTVCIEVGRRTLTHTSRTVPAHRSRKWMSGQATALAINKDRRPFANLTATCPLREPDLPSARMPPSPLDFTYHGCPRFSLAVEGSFFSLRILVQHLVKLSDAGITYPRVVFRDEPLYLFGFLSTEATSLIAECLI